MPPGSERIGNRFRRRADTAARITITLAGVAVILAISAIFVFITLEILPLLSGADAHQAAERLIGSGDPPLVLAADEHQEKLFVVRRSGMLELFELTSGSGAPLERHPLVEAGSPIDAAHYDPDEAILTVVDEDGTAFLWRIRFRPRFDEGERTIVLETGQVASFELPLSVRAGEIVAAHPEEGSHVVAIRAGRDVHLFSHAETETPAGDVQTEERFHTLDLASTVVPEALALTADGRRLVIGSRDGTLQRWAIPPGAAPEHVESVLGSSRGGAGITALRWLIGDRTLVVGDSGGAVSAWILVRSEQAPDGWRTTRIHELESHRRPVSLIAPSQRNKAFLTADDGGLVKLHHSTSERTLLELEGPSGRLRAIAFAPKGNGALAAGDGGVVSAWRISAPHPEVTFGTLFTPVWYEGYPQPEHVWQSSGGTDDFEPKLGLVPLIVGTVKGTFYAMLFALPVAILGALYTSQFLRPAWRNIVKSTVEIMAALPSVVLGFLAGLWLAPRLAEIVPGVIAALLLMPVAVVGASVLWWSLPAIVRARLPEGSEVLLLLPVVALAIWASIGIGEWIEAGWLGGDFTEWLYDVAGERYDQRNALVVGFAMGFAVIPIVFTIAEDALSNVPPRLVSASLGLGATPWQTAVRVVLPTASPGIFSATMIGFGRAVGETMIVLMATGNTPIMDFSPFNGFRALSANIAVEIPEAPHGGTLYRVLFLAALLLFVMTFALNTAAEIVRLRLRERYSRL